MIRTGALGTRYPQRGAGMADLFQIAAGNLLSPQVLRQVFLCGSVVLLAGSFMIGPA